MSDRLSTNTKTVVDELVLSAPQELADVDLQRRLWVCGSESEISSLNEVVSALYDDSGLLDALDRSSVTYSKSIDDDLKRLQEAIRPFVVRSSEMTGARIGELIETPEWKLVIASAKSILNAVEEGR